MDQKKHTPADLQKTYDCLSDTLKQALNELEIAQYQIQGLQEMPTTDIIEHSGEN